MILVFIRLFEINQLKHRIPMSIKTDGFVSDLQIM